MSRSATATGASRVSVLNVSACSQRLAIETGRVDRVIAMPPVTRVPKTSPVLKGVASVNSELTVVIDLREVLGSEHRGDVTRLLRFAGEYDGHPVAVPVTSIGEVERVSTDRLTPPDGTVETDDSPFSAEIGSSEGQPERLMLDPERLVAAVRELKMKRER